MRLWEHADPDPARSVECSTTTATREKDGEAPRGPTVRPREPELKERDRTGRDCIRVRHIHLVSRIFIFYILICYYISFYKCCKVCGTGQHITMSRTAGRGVPRIFKP